MLKQEFLEALAAKLSGLPEQDIKERLDFYSEMIDDRIEEGCTQAQAVLDIGSVEDIATEIIGGVPLVRIARERIKHKRRLGALEIVLLSLGSPIWLSLAVAAVAVVLSLYVTLWSIGISLWATLASLIACALGAVLAGGAFAVMGHMLAGAATVGAGIFLLGLSVFVFFLCKYTTKGIVLLCKKTVLVIKKCCMRRGCRNA